MARYDLVRSSSLQGRSIRKVMRGVGNFRAARIFFLLTFPLQEYFFPYASTFFLGYSLCIDFFPLNFPLHEFFLCSPPLPHNFSYGHPVFSRVQCQHAICKQLKDR